MAKDLSVDLYDLWRAGKVSIPQVAAVYAQASRELHTTSWQEDPVGHGPLARVLVTWRELRDELQNATAHTAENLLALGEALITIMNLYASADEIAAAQLRRSIDDALASQVLQKPPTDIPTAKRPNDPHDTSTVDLPIDIPFFPDTEISLEIPTA